MGQKVNPHGLRVGVIKDRDSRSFAGKSIFGDTLVEDHKIREYLKKKLYKAGIPAIEIERDAAKVKVNIHCAKPGMVIGQKGSEIDKLRTELEKLTGGKTVLVNIIEVKSPDLDAQLVAENIASQLERRISYRRAVKQAIGRTMQLGAKGIKIQLSGRVGGAEIARTETSHEGTVPLQTIRADIDYGFTEAKTTYGRIGVKVWLYRGEILHESRNSERRNDRPRRFNRDNRNGNRPNNRDNRNGGANGNRGGYNNRPRREGGDK